MDSSLNVDGFERFLQITWVDLEVFLSDRFAQMLWGVYLNPRYLRGSDFLMRFSQGRWAEEIVVRTINATEAFRAIPYGPSSVAPSDPFEMERYFERLDRAETVGKRDPRRSSESVAMTDARGLLEALTLPLTEKLVRLVPTASGKELRGWAQLHGWDASVDEQVLARQAALNLVLRGLIACRLDVNALPATASAQRLIAHSNRLLRMLGIEPQPFSLLDLLALRADLALQIPRIAALAKALQRDPEDILGDAYTAWIPQRIRRAPGQFWTPRPIAQLMSQWAIRSPTDQVLDPAFGSGVLLLAAVDRLVQRGASSETALQAVAGVEISPLVFLMGLTNLLLRYPPGVRLRLRWDDFLLPRGEPAMILREPTAAYALEVRQMALPGMATTASTTFSE
ncbi:MAG: hypothetical protein D6759_06835, partial [Chloroflexi bacterium]